MDNSDDNYCGISTDESECDSIMTENGSDSSDTTIIMYNSEDSESDQGQTSAVRPDIDRSVTVSKQCMNYISVCMWYLKYSNQICNVFDLYNKLGLNI